MGKSSSKGMGLAGLILTGDHAGNSAPKYPTTNNVDAKNDVAGDELNLAFVSAGEGKLNSWLTGRAGFSTTVYNWKTDSTDNLTSAVAGAGKTSNYRDIYSTTLTLGLSIAVGDITIDGALNQNLFYNGSSYGQVSATWAWGAKE